MTPVYTTKLGLTTQKISVGALRIDGLLLETYDMGLARFLLQDSLKKVRFFKKTFLLADTNMEVILRMIFLSMSNVDVEFAMKSEKLTWRSYIAIKILSTTNRVKLINKSIFAKAALDENSEIFIVQITTLEIPTTISFHPSQVTQVAIFWRDKTPTKISARFADYSNVYFLNLVIELYENTAMNEHVIKLLDEKQPLYKLIYAFSLV